MSVDQSEVTRLAITAVQHNDHDSARKWFELIGEVHRELTGGLDSPDELSLADFRSEFDSRAQSDYGSAALEEFWKYLEDNDSERSAMTVIADLADPADIDEVLELYGAAPEQEVTSGGDAVLPQIVGQFGEGWAGWDGSEGGWAEFRDWLYNATNGVDPSWYGAVYAELDPLNKADRSERIRRMRELGFTINAPTRDPGEDTEAGQPALIELVVGKFGEGWAGWDGSEGGWAEFRDWLYNATNGVDPSWYGAVYAELDPLNKADRSERIRRMQELGFTINAPTSQLVDKLAESTEIRDVIDTFLDEDVESIVAFGLEEVPEAAELSADEIEEAFQMFLQAELEES